MIHRPTEIQAFYNLARAERYPTGRLALTDFEVKLLWLDRQHAGNLHNIQKDIKLSRQMIEACLRRIGRTLEAMEARGDSFNLEHLYRSRELNTARSRSFSVTRHQRRHRDPTHRY